MILFIGLHLFLKIKEKGFGNYVTEVDINRQEARMLLHPRARLKAEELPALIASYNGELKMQTGETPALLYQQRKGKNKDCTAVMEKTEEILKALGKLRREED